MKSLVLAIWIIAVAASLAVAAEPITIGERVTIASKVMGEQRTLLISPPANYARGQGRFPVLYMTDGDAHLIHTRGTVDVLARNGLMPDVIIVGVANTDRTRDLSPTPSFRVREDGTREVISNRSGAGKFLDFFAKELIPYVEKHYRTLPYRIFSGHSLGGLFALTALATRSELFQAYIAASPALDFENDYPLRTLEAFFKGRQELQRTLFVTMANEEAGDPAPTRFDRLQQLLGSVQATGFVWSAKPMADETHGSVVLRSHYWGLRKIFELWPLPIGPNGFFLGGLEGLNKHYAELAQRLGFSVRPSEETVNSAGYGSLSINDAEGAIALFKYNVEINPLSANAYDSLGEALERAGRLEEALANYTKATENAKKNADKRLAVFAANRDRAAEALAKQKKNK
jgi:predicted alpha/beta superfamily hydrolase